MNRLAWCPIALASAPFLAALTGCRSPTQIQVTVGTDVTCADVRATAFTSGELEALESSPATTESTTCSGNHLGSVVLVPSGSDDARVGFKVVTSLNDKNLDYCMSDAGVGSHDCIVARRALRYLPHTSLNVIVTMEAACQGVVCDPSSTCVQGGCVSATIVNPGECTSGCGDAVLGDAGVDATVSGDGGSLDGATDATVTGDGPGPGDDGGVADSSTDSPLVAVGDGGYSPPSDCDWAGTEPRAAWPQEGYCASHRNRSPYHANLSSSMHLSAPIPVDGTPQNAPSISADGTLYLTGEGASVQAFNPDGSLKWRYTDDAGAVFNAMPVIAPDGTIRIYDDTATSVYLTLDPISGKPLVRKTNTAQVSVANVLGPGGIEYVVDDQSATLNARSDGGLLWTGPTSDNHALPTVEPDRSILVTTDGYLSRVLPGGADGGTVRAVTNADLQGLAVAPSGEIRAQTNPTGVLMAFDPLTLAARWSALFDASSSELVGFSIDDDGNTWVGTQSDGLVKVAPDGGKVDKHFGRCGPPVIDAAGVLVVWCDGNLTAISPDFATVYWTVILPGQSTIGVVIDTPVIGPDGTVFFTLLVEGGSSGKDTYALYAVRP